MEIAVEPALPDVRAALEPDDVLARLRQRYATKKFDPSRRIPAEHWAAMEEALVLSPSSYGLQPWKFIVVDDPATRERLVAASWGQRQVADASHLVVFAVRNDLNAADAERHLERTAAVRGVPIERLAGFRKMLHGTIEKLTPAERLDWNTHQAYIALGQFMAVAAILGIDTCPMEGFEPAKYNETLGLTQAGYHAAVVCPAGYRAADDKSAAAPKVRFPLDEVIQHV